MLFQYKKIKIKHDPVKGDNIYQYSAYVMKACCERIMGFVMEYKVDFSIDKDVLIFVQPNMPVEKAILMPCCLFCGERHVGQEVDEKGNIIQPKKHKII